MCSRIMDHQYISHINLRKHTIDCKFIIVLTQRSCHIIFVIARRIFFAHYCNVMVSSVHCRTHKVNRTCIYTNVFFMCMFLVDCSCNQASIRSHHETSHLCIDCDISHTCRYQYFFVYTADTITDRTNIIRLLIWFVRNTYTTGQVDEFDVYTCFLLKFYRNFKQYFRKHRIIFICYGITCKECMDTKFFCSFCFQNFESFK